MTRLNPELDPTDREYSYDVRDERFAVLIRQFVEELAPYENRDLLREILVTVVKLANQGTDRGDLKILRTAVKELRYAFKVFSAYRDVRKVAIFGSARSRPEHPDYVAAREVASKLAERGYMVITGAGGGIMQAGNEGAGPEKSFGLNILLPFEQEANQFVDGGSKLINFRYFFTRKLFFIKDSDALILLPGGFGTMDEGFEALTLIQTGKSNPTPVVMLERPGGSYWKGWCRFVKENLLERGLISREDRALYFITDDPEEACDEIGRFYRRYHSSRYVNRKQTLVLRLSEALPEGRLGLLNDRFGDILVDGLIASCDSFPEEDDEPELLPLPRVSLAFNQRSFGRLRQLIDELNR